MSTNEQQRQLLDLQFLEGTLNDEGITTQLTQYSAENPTSFLSVMLPDGKVVQLLYIPSAEAVAESNLLQFYAHLPAVEGAQNRDKLSLLNKVNAHTTLGYFSEGNEGELFYRYVYVLPRFDVPRKAQFMEVYFLFVATYGHFREQIEAYLSGKIDLNQLLAEGA